MASWSFSRLKSFETCPKQFYHVTVLKEHPVVETDAMLYGTAMHKAAEDRYKRFSYINDLLYKSFEKTSEQISKPFISTQNTKNIGKLLQDRINQYKTTLDDGTEYFEDISNSRKNAIDYMA